jgi:hypothetical protein
VHLRALGRHYWLFNDLLVATKPVVAKGAKWRGKVFGSSSKRSARSATVTGPPPTPAAAPATTAESGKPSTPRGSAQAGLDGEEGVAGVLEEGPGYTYRHMVPLRKCELRNVSDASAEKRWGRRNVFQLINADLHIITFEASSPEDKDSWIHSLDEGTTTSPNISRSISDFR